MYKCHLCNLETKQLNDLMSRHYKVHYSKTYTKEQYKVAVLAHNGRHQKICMFYGIQNDVLQYLDTNIV